MVGYLKGAIFINGSLQVKNGKYYAVLRINGKQKWINLNIEEKKGNKRKAEQALSETILMYSENPSLADKINFHEYIKEWLKSVRPQVDIITYEGYKQCIDNHISPYFEDKSLKLQDISIKDIEDYYNFKAVSGRLDGKDGGLSQSTLKRHRILLSLTFKKAIRDGLLKYNPCEYAKMPKFTAKKSIAKFYTAEQCQELLTAVKGTPLYDMIYITIMYGLRRSELLGLRWQSVDMINNIITINHTVTLQNEVVAKDNTKNKTSNRVYPIIKEIKEILIRLKKEQLEYKKLFGNCYTDSGYIFTKADGTPYYPSYPTHELQKALKKNNLPHIRWHDLRHTTASLLILKKWQMKEISEWLGHADITTTMNIYGHINLDHKRALGNTLSGLFEKSV